MSPAPSPAPRRPVPVSTPAPAPHCRLRRRTPSLAPHRQARLRPLLAVLVACALVPSGCCVRCSKEAEAAEAASAAAADGVPAAAAGVSAVAGALAPNTLSDAERAAGWELLFDGRTTAGWRGYRRPDVPSGWVVEDGCLTRTGSDGDLLSVWSLTDFELRLQWKIAAGGNSGIFFHVDEDSGEYVYESGPEFQVLDNAGHADGSNPATSAASAYGLYAPLRDVTRPVGEWNDVLLRVDGGHVEHWLNGVQVVDYQLGSPEWTALVAASKFSKWPGYGRAGSGHIALQDHGDPVWYRDIKVRRLE